MDGRELFLGLLLLIVAVASLLAVGRVKWEARASVAGLIVLLGAGALVGWIRNHTEADVDLRMPVEVSGDQYATSRACRSCHPRHYASWHASFHRTMTQKSSPESVLAPFDGETLTSRGRTYRLSRHDDEHWAQMPDLEYEAELRYEHGVDIEQVPQAQVPTVYRPVVMTTGSHHFQTYWVPARYGHEVRQLPWVWLIGDRRWIPTEDSFLLSPDDPRHLVLWNKNCIQCHSTGWRPGRSPDGQELFSEVAELGISCESCHAAAAEHVARHHNPVTRYQAHWRGRSGGGIVNPRRLDPAAATDVCGQCHAFTVPQDYDEWWVHGYLRLSRPGDPLEEHRHIVHYTTNPEQEWLETYVDRRQSGIQSMFWPDGTVRVGGREYHGLVLSPCYERGQGREKLSCLSCHSMHDYASADDQLKPSAVGNAACTQCHGEPRFSDQVSSHTHHAADSGGSQCYNCHMPHTTYALFKAIRSHRVDSPNVQMSSQHGRPNACNLCHLDRTLAWTADRLQGWYGIEAPQLKDDESEVAASLLWLLRGNAAQRAIVAWSFGWDQAHSACDDGWMAPFLAELLKDPYAAVRYIAHKSLIAQPGFEDFSYDFIAPLQERQRAAERAREIWQRRPGTLSRLPKAELLLLGEGRLERTAIDRLLEQRDNTPIAIGE